MVDDDKKPAAAPRPVVHPHATPAAGQVVGQADDKAAEANAERTKHAQAQNAPAQFTPEQLATPAPQLAGSRQMYVIVGPYKGSVLTMPDAEAENAKDNHWAVEMDTVAPPFDADNPPDHDHELTDEDRANAVKEANEWAAKVNPPPEPPPPEGGEGGVTKGGKAVNPAPAGGYETRTAPTKK